MSESFTRDPLVSVVMCFLNEETFLAEAVESVLNQSYQNWKLVLVDDGSTDGSGEIARNFANDYKGKISYVTHEGCLNKGLSASRNLGIAHGEGDLISFLDADDVWLPEKLAHQVGVMTRAPDIGMICGASLYWNSWGPSQEADKFVKVGCPQNRAFDPPELMEWLYPLGKGAAPSMNSLLVRRQVIHQLNGFVNEFCGMYEDQVFLTKVYLSHAVYVSDQICDRYRIRNGSICERVNRNGGYHIYRRRYLHWAKRYMEQNGIRHHRIRKLLAGAFAKQDGVEGASEAARREKSRVRRIRASIKSTLGRALGGE